MESKKREKEGLRWCRVAKPDYFFARVLSLETHLPRHGGESVVLLQACRIGVHPQRNQLQASILADLVEPAESAVGLSQREVNRRERERRDVPSLRQPLVALGRNLDREIALAGKRTRVARAPCMRGGPSGDNS
jgi:hypothetical protein